MIHPHEREAVLAYVRSHEPTSVRDVAKSVFGDGRTRSAGRVKAYAILRALEDEGIVRRTRPNGSYEPGVGDQWSTVR
jgi:Fe2+ or Zn2+ uptake regulation protein